MPEEIDHEVASPFVALVGGHVGSWTPRMICANDGSNTGTCRGDSGGPLMRRLTAKSGAQYYVQTGINSFGDVNCTYTGFARVSNQLSWINGYVTGNKCSYPK